MATGGSVSTSPRSKASRAEEVRGISTRELGCRSGNQLSSFLVFPDSSKCLKHLRTNRDLSTLGRHRKALTLVSTVTHNSYRAKMVGFCCCCCCCYFLNMHLKSSAQINGNIEHKDLAPDLTGINFLFALNYGWLL